MNTIADTLLTLTECAEEANCSVQKLRKAIKAGRLRAFQPTPHGHIRVSRSALYEWLGRPAARNAEPPLDSIDWETPIPGADGIVVCDEGTEFLRVHTSRMAKFYAAKFRQQGR